MTEQSRPSPNRSTRTSGGGIPLFTFAGIRVSLHWMWFLVALYEINSRRARYGSIGWNIAEYLTLFFIVLLHEFGHAFACRSVNGQADRIMLWPLGGVAFVRPPQRPAAVLWSIVAGPLVNLVLIPCLWYANHEALRGGYSSDMSQFMRSIHYMNLGLLIFNMIPIYPLDGGQILRALLWFVIGPARSLLVASILGIAGTLIGFAYMFTRLNGEGRIWLGIFALFAISQSWYGLRAARKLTKLMALPRSELARCPSCGQAPPTVPLWRCECGASIDISTNHSTCPRCRTPIDAIACPYCAVISPLRAWTASRPVPSITPPPIPVGAPTVSSPSHGGNARE
jgi:Zn-dependent protease